MEFDLKTIEALAPDQASLSAASRLTRQSNWPRLEKSDQLGLLWGECQGSGSNPYRVVVDTGDHGYKCTCPSRKFPCKHTLALMWIAATTPASFTAAGSTPEWVNDWLGRRRKVSPQPAAAQAPGAGGKSIGEASRDDESADVEDAAAVERREAAQRKRTLDT
ncbi:MAG: SWIM zinc finger family protein, partial [Mesorhizobium sp.]